eukprot:365661-Chlamydomonas_euryale.AAC.51
MYGRVKGRGCTFPHGFGATPSKAAFWLDYGAHGRAQLYIGSMDTTGVNGMDVEFIQYISGWYCLFAVHCKDAARNDPCTASVFEASVGEINRSTWMPEEGWWDGVVWSAGHMPCGGIGLKRLCVSRPGWHPATA